MDQKNTNYCYMTGYSHQGNQEPKDPGQWGGDYLKEAIEIIPCLSDKDQTAAYEQGYKDSYQSSKK